MINQNHFILPKFERNKKYRVTFLGRYIKHTSITSCVRTTYSILKSDLKNFNGISLVGCIRLMSKHE